MAQDSALLAELSRALLAEFGARAIYRRLARLVRDPELAQVLARFAEDESQAIADVRGLIQACGARARRRSVRRTLLAECLAWTAPLAGPRPALRICVEAEATRARWYAHLDEHLSHKGAGGMAQTCAALANMKERHAQALQTWVVHARGR
jgi:rubrerythrin